MKTRTAIAPEAGQRGFWALIVTQFQGAFSDNVLKWLVISMIGAMGSRTGNATSSSPWLAFVRAPFHPFFHDRWLFRGPFSKRTVTIGIKLFEIFVMLLALSGLATNWLWLAIACVFLWRSTAPFSPSKYGLLPELLPEENYRGATASSNSAPSFPLSAGRSSGRGSARRLPEPGLVRPGPHRAGGVWTVTSFGISKVPAADPAKEFRANFLADLWGQIKLIRQDRVLWLATVGNTYFFLIAALIQSLIIIYAKDVLNISDPRWSSYLQAATGIGIGLGSFAAG